MHIIVVGVDHTTASIELREQLTCSLRQVPQVLRASQEVVQESVLLSTCNRIELYAVCQDTKQARIDLLQVLSETRLVALADLEAHYYDFADEQAIAHLMGVTCGLYSLVPGEPQIQGQVAESIEIAQGGGYAGPITSALFRAALVAGKRARSETGISRNAASISHVAVQLARQLFPRLNDACVLLLGSGK
ncbi:MAG: glutamyl-tRNA reductase, partial [Ktedonobacteraceae bacterium]